LEKYFLIKNILFLFLTLVYKKLLKNIKKINLIYFQSKNNLKDRLKHKN